MLLVAIRDMNSGKLHKQIITCKFDSHQIPNCKVVTAFPLLVNQVNDKKVLISKTLLVSAIDGDSRVGYFIKGSVCQLLAISKGQERSLIFGSRETISLLGVNFDLWRNRIFVSSLQKYHVMPSVGVSLWCNG